VSTPPPSRYRVVERDRRLVVVDTWDKCTPPAGVPTSPTPPTSRAPRPDLRGTMGAPPQRTGAIGGLLVTLACGGAMDGEWHPILTTRDYYDARGPREIVLSPAAARRLGSLLSRAAIGLAVIVVILWAVPYLLFLLVGGFWAGIAGFSSVARPAVTRWLDGLEAQSTT
jgi:hypothetical protein